MKNKLNNILYYFLLVLLGLAIAALVGTEVYCWITYGGKPAAEIPAWALWFMFGGGRK